MGWTTPGTPLPNQVLTSGFWDTQVRDNLNALGAMYGLKQRVIASSATNFTAQTSASYADITNATLSITTTGGRLVIYQQINAGSEGYEAVVFGSGSTGVVCYVKAFVGATDLGAYGIAGPNVASGSITAGHRQWSATPTAGTYTVKLQYKIAATNNYNNVGMLLVAEEWGLVSA